MQGVLLDTNVLSKLMRLRPSVGVLNWFSRLKDIVFYTSAITQAELLLGVALLPDCKLREVVANAVEQMFEQDSSIVPYPSTRVLPMNMRPWLLLGPSLAC